MSTSIVEYSKTEAALADLESRYKGVIFDVTTHSGMADAKTSRAELRGYRLALEKTRVEIKAPALKRSQEIDTEAKRISGALEALENPIAEQIRWEEGKRERERVAKEQAEKDRIEAEQRAIREAQEKKMAEERAEIARQQEALAKERREAQEKIDAEARSSRLKIEEEQRAARMKLEEEARQERLARQAREDVERQKRASEEAALKAEREKIEVARREVEAEDRKKREAKEAKAREVQRKVAELEDALGMLTMFKARFGHLPKFAAVVAAIDELEIA